jgi:glyoxylase-like metal-dependent hydrolase (beta-lactamase superfamily II)
MDYPICVTCGVQGNAKTDECPICVDERQYVGWEGQAWTTMSDMERDGYRNRIEEVEDGLWGIVTEPRFAIGQRSLLVRTDNGNVLWDPASLVDDETSREVAALGGIDAISASHPHFYGVIAEWSQAFGNIPIFLPRHDGDWIQRSDANYQLYEDTAEPIPGLTLIRCGGHFDGSAVLHWPAGAEGRGALFTGDTIQVVMDRDAVSFMRSYPNYVPLNPDTIRDIVARIAHLKYDRIYGGWWNRNVGSGATAAVAASAARYISWVEG